MKIQDKIEGRASFCVGTGRCGTKLLHELLSRERDIASCHERDAINETFQRYATWYGLPVDKSGFFETKRREIVSDLRKRRHSFESSAFLSLDILDLHRVFGAKAILFVRNPADVVNSYIAKGWYKDELYVLPNFVAPGYQPGVSHFHHTLGRIVPVGEEYDRWNEMGRVGKLSWYWAAINRRVLEQFSEMPSNAKRIFLLEEFGYREYVELVEFLGVRCTLGERAFLGISRARPNQASSRPTIATWTDQDICEFEGQVHDVSNMLGYPARFSDLVRPSKRTESQSIQRSAIGLVRAAVNLFRGGR